MDAAAWMLGAIGGGHIGEMTQGEGIRKEERAETDVCECVCRPILISVTGEK